MAAIIFNGSVGKSWSNETEKVYYQFHCKWERTCGACAQYHLAVANDWPIPLHHGCRCYAEPIFPGKSAEPWCDFRKIAEGLSDENKSALVGAGNWKLIQSGSVEWKDVVTQYRVRDLHEVASRNRLTEQQMVKAGIPKSHAENAFAKVNTPAHVLADQKRQELIKKVLSLGVSKTELAEAFGERIAQAVHIRGGPSGPQTMPRFQRPGTQIYLPFLPYVPERPKAKPEDKKSASPVIVVPLKPAKPPEALPTVEVPPVVLEPLVLPSGELIPIRDPKPAVKPKRKKPPKES